jgi:hypothetical protein
MLFMGVTLVVGVGSMKVDSIRAYSDSAKEQAGTIESSRRLAEYTGEDQVEKIYSCWSGDEGEPRELEQRVALEELVARDGMSSSAQVSCSEGGGKMLASTAARTGGRCMACMQGIRKNIEDIAQTTFAVGNFQGNAKDH